MKFRRQAWREFLDSFPQENSFDNQDKYFRQVAQKAIADLSEVSELDKVDKITDTGSRHLDTVNHNPENSILSKDKVDNLDIVQGQLNLHDLVDNHLNELINFKTGKTINSFVRDNFYSIRKELISCARRVPLYRGFEILANLDKEKFQSLRMLNLDHGGIYEARIEDLVIGSRKSTRCILVTTRYLIGTTGLCSLPVYFCESTKVKMSNGFTENIDVYVECSSLPLESKRYPGLLALLFGYMKVDRSEFIEKHLCSDDVRLQLFFGSDNKNRPYLKAFLPSSFSVKSLPFSLNAFSLAQYNNKNEHIQDVLFKSNGYRVFFDYESIYVNGSQAQGPFVEELYSFDYDIRTPDKYVRPSFLLYNDWISPVRVAGSILVDPKEDEMRIAYKKYIAMPIDQLFENMKWEIKEVQPIKRPAPTKNQNRRR